LRAQRQHRRRRHLPRRPLLRLRLRPRPPRRHPLLRPPPHRLRRPPPRPPSSQPRQLRLRAGMNITGNGATVSTSCPSLRSTLIQRCTTGGGGPTGARRAPPSTTAAASARGSSVVENVSHPRSWPATRSPRARPSSSITVTLAAPARLARVAAARCASI